MKKAVGDTIYSRVCDSLRDGILSGELGPGQRLKMTDLVAKYGISPMPIREALQKLQGEGLITIEPHRGAKVRQVDREFVSMVHELRTAIECMLGRKAAANITGKAVAELERLQQEYDRAAEEGNAAKVVSANLKFHALIYSYGNNPPGPGDPQQPVLFDTRNPHQIRLLRRAHPTGEPGAPPNHPGPARP